MPSIRVSLPQGESVETDLFLDQSLDNISEFTSVLFHLTEGEAFALRRRTIEGVTMIQA